jgi:hypothetical protein
MSSMFLVRLWHCVTVASLLRSSEATGLPTMSLRPRTTACNPERLTPVVSKRRMHPAGVQGAKSGSAAREDR